MSAPRNFWIKAEIDTPSGAKQCLSGGPAAADGGFTLTIDMRDEGESRRVLKLTGLANRDGTLRLYVSRVDDNYIHHISGATTTQRDKPKPPKANRKATPV